MICFWVISVEYDQAMKEKRQKGESREERGAFVGSSPRPFKNYEFHYFGPLWANGALGDILTSIVSNSHFGKRLVARDMTICGFYVGPHVNEHVDYA